MSAYRSNTGSSLLEKGEQKIPQAAKMNLTFTTAFKFVGPIIITIYFSLEDGGSMFL
jgi:hypothetical protein